jgi:hypothetical protein
MKQSTKARLLADRITVEQEAVELLHRVLRDNIRPDDRSDAAAHRAIGMELLKTAMKSLEEAATYVRGIA